MKKRSAFSFPDSIPTPNLDEFLDDNSSVPYRGSQEYPSGLNASQGTKDNPSDPCRGSREFRVSHGTESGTSED